MKLLKNLLPHALVVLGLMFLCFLILDEFNPMMNFIDNGISRVLLAALCLLGIASAILAWRGDAKK